MNVWRIAMKELKALRDFKMLVFLVVTPVLLMLILGTIFSNAFRESVAVGEIRVLYRLNSPDSRLASDWNAFVRQAEQAGIVMVEAGPETDGKSETADNRYVGYVEISDSGLLYYGNSRSRIESDLASAMLTAFADRRKIAAAAAEPQAEGIMTGISAAEHVQVQSLNAARQPSAMDYYAIAMVTLIILYGSLTAADLIGQERKKHTALRLLASPVTKAEIFAGKILGHLLLNAICVVVVVLICKYMFDVDWGHHLGLVLLVLFSEIVFALSLGLGFSYLFKGNVAGSLLMIIIQVGAFIGGSYFPVQDLTGVMRTVASFSPLEWTNDALLQLIYADNGSAAAEAMMLNVGFSVLLLGAAVMLMRRREGL